MLLIAKNLWRMHRGYKGAITIEEFHFVRVATGSGRWMTIPTAGLGNSGCGSQADPGFCPAAHQDRHPPATAVTTVKRQLADRFGSAKSAWCLL